jgi:mRNA interferase RelE/StbE
MNTISWNPKALKQVRDLPASAGAAISQAISTALVDLSTARNVKKLVNHECDFCLRVRKYRVLFDFNSAVRIVSIEALEET